MGLRRLMEVVPWFDAEGAWPRASSDDESDDETADDGRARPPRRRCAFHETPGAAARARPRGNMISSAWRGAAAVRPRTIRPARDGRRRGSSADAATPQRRPSDDLARRRRRRDARARLRASATTRERDYARARLRATSDRPRTRPRQTSAWHPRRCRPPPRNIHVAPAAAPRLAPRGPHRSHARVPEPAGALRGPRDLQSVATPRRGARKRDPLVPAAAPKPSRETSCFGRRRLRGISTSRPRRCRDPPPRKTAAE